MDRATIIKYAKLFALCDKIFNEVGEINITRATIMRGNRICLYLYFNKIFDLIAKNNNLKKYDKKFRKYFMAINSSLTSFYIFDYKEKKEVEYFFDIYKSII